MKNLILKCNCSIPCECPKLKVMDYEDKDCEIQLGKEAIYLNEKSIDKLIKYLGKIINK